MSAPFRAAPWISYSAQPSQPTHPMDEDVEMDAPQISILREEESPPPQRKTASSRKSKTTPKGKTGEFPYLPRPRKEFISDDEYDEPEEEEDQLIDDDDDELNKPTTAQAPGRSVEAGQKRKTPSKRKPRKIEKKVEEDKKGKEKQPQQAAPHTTSQMTVETSEAEPLRPDALEDIAPLPSNTPQDIPPESVTTLKPSAPPKKKASPRKPPALPRPRAKAAPTKYVLRMLTCQVSEYSI